MFLVFLVFSLGSLLLAQTEYRDRTFFDLTIAKDGRVEALINANDPEWMTVYRQFIELNTDTRELMIAFDVATSSFPSTTSLKTESHIMTSVIASGQKAFKESENVTANAEGYIHSNMVLRYDKMVKEMVMIYQSSCYWYYSTSSDPDIALNWASDSSLDAYNQTLQMIRYSEGEWTEPEQILKDLVNPHVHFQIIESLDLNDAGYAAQIMLPVHHLSENTPADNYEMLARTERSMNSDSTWEITFMNETENGGSGFLQASIVRVPGDTEINSTLVAFLRDANGYWVYRSTSEDDGYSWTDPQATALPNPDQMSQALYLHSGMLMLIYNPSQSMASEESNGDRYSNCHHLAVGLSADYGLTWQFSRMLEYAYDGMFNYPVALQDPACNNIYLTYSVETDETKGCIMLDECTTASQNTSAYIKFTVLTEEWVMNDFDYKYDVSDTCTWQLAQSLKPGTGFKTTEFDTASTTTEDFTTITVLSIVLGILILGNLVWTYLLCVKTKLLKYSDLDVVSNRGVEYDTMN